MRAVATGLFLLLLVLGGAAQAQTLSVPECNPTDDPSKTVFLCKTVRIYNNNPADSTGNSNVYPVLFRGAVEELPEL